MRKRYAIRLLSCCRFSRIAAVTLILIVGCKERASPSGGAAPQDAVVSPAVAVALLTDKNPKDEPFCLDTTGSDGRRLVVGRVGPSQAGHEAGRFYLAVFNSETEVTGTRHVTMNRTSFTDPAAAVQAATGMGARHFQVCKFSEL